MLKSEPPGVPHLMPPFFYAEEKDSSRGTPWALYQVDTLYFQLDFKTQVTISAWSKIIWFISLTLNDMPWILNLRCLMFINNSYRMQLNVIESPMEPTIIFQVRLHKNLAPARTAHHSSLESRMIVCPRRHNAMP